MTGLSRTTIHKGIQEIEKGTLLPPGRIRKGGGGRRKSEVHYPSLRSEILKCVEPATRRDPESPLRWTSKSLKKIVRTLKEQDPSRNVGTSVVRRILQEEKFSLQANRKTHEGGNHPDRDAQFTYIARQKEDHLKTHDPVISIDVKKKELIGNYKNSGSEWHLKGQPTPRSLQFSPQRRDQSRAVWDL